ncbi:MAG: hypothetical protein A2020_08520 [Lentisphaerae bacterium GWF2_45_14]|nr:MAG: hypothetical protein A2020_08520 [Lentisphaerae bacterium GWF2_45_14]
MENLTSMAGFFSFCLFAWLLSSSRRKINWRPVIGGIILQFMLAAFLFCVPAFRGLFLVFSDIFTNLLEFSREGIIFVFGELGKKDSPQGMILAFQVFPFIIVFSSLMAFLHYIKVIPSVVKFLARIISSTLRTSGAESLCAASNIFAGIESATAVRPYIKDMTDSELFLILVTGMSTVASSVMALYVSFLSDTFPAIAGHLISASMISIPASFVIAKLMVPETSVPLTANVQSCEVSPELEAKSATESLVSGADAGYKLAVGVAVTLIAFIGILGIVQGIAAHVTGQERIIQKLLAYIFYPLAFLTGVSASDVPAAADMLGKRVILTEIPAYLDLAAFSRAGGNPRTVLIISYALCGFSHIASMAIFVGGIGALAPSKISTLSKLGVRALIGSTLVTLMTGAVAGIFYWGQSGLIK